MVNHKIILNSISKVKEFVEITMMVDFDVDIISGRYTINAKSIMGIFSLDLSKKLELVIRGGNEEEITEYLKSITRFIVT